MPSQRASRIKNAVENKFVALLKKDAPEPTDKELKVLMGAVKYLAVEAKMLEEDWGSGIKGLNDDEGGENDTETDI